MNMTKKGFQKRIEKFAKDLKTFEENSKDSFYKAILLGVYHALLDNKENFEFDQSILVEVFGQNFFDELQRKKEKLQLDLNPSNFQMQSHVINDILMNKRLLLRVYELRRGLSACVEEQFNSFDIVRRIAENEQKENYVAVDVVYTPVLRIDQIINCYFTSSMRNAYRAASHLKKGLEITAAEQCYACNKFFVQKKSRKSLENLQLHARNYL